MTFTHCNSSFPWPRLVTYSQFPGVWPWASPSGDVILPPILKAVTTSAVTLGFWTMAQRQRDSDGQVRSHTCLCRPLLGQNLVTCGPISRGRLGARVFPSQGSGPPLDLSFRVCGRSDKGSRGRGYQTASALQREGVWVFPELLPLLMLLGGKLRKETRPSGTPVLFIPY